MAQQSGDYGAGVGPYEVLGVSLAHHLGHTLASMTPTIVLAPNTQQILDLVCDDLQGMVDAKANEYHRRGNYGDEHELQHSCPCWHQAAVQVMANLCHRHNGGSIQDARFDAEQEDRKDFESRLP